MNRTFCDLCGKPATHDIEDAAGKPPLGAKGRFCYNCCLAVIRADFLRREVHEDMTIPERTAKFAHAMMFARQIVDATTTWVRPW